MSLTLQALHGRVLDLDSYGVRIPPEAWRDVFGDRIMSAMENDGRVAQVKKMFGDANAPAPPINADTVWVKHDAPMTAWGTDMNRRPEVLDMMGIQRQLVVPLLGAALTVQALGGGVGGPLTSDEEKAVAWGALDRINEWMAKEFAHKEPDRLRYVGYLGSARPGATPETLEKEAKRLIELGLKGALMAAGVPPAGLAPAHRALDNLYATLAEAEIPIVIRNPSSLGFAAPAWVKIDPANVTASFVGAMNFLRMLTLGGVFERHPKLRVVVIKCGASWVGSLADFLDFRTDDKRAKAMFSAQPYGETKLSLKPSEYFARNVRVTPYNFEQVDKWLQQYPHLQDVYCYSSHFPDHTGGGESLKIFYESIAPLGDVVVEKFFCTNAKLIMP